MFDGSHEAPDVLLDALLSFKLLKINGVIAFDEYLWQENLDNIPDVLRSPKIAIDAFANIYCQKLRIFSALIPNSYSNCSKSKSIDGFSDLHKLDADN